jgi:hypothetical protein
MLSQFLLKYGFLELELELLSNCQSQERNSGMHSFNSELVVIFK